MTEHERKALAKEQGVMADVVVEMCRNWRTFSGQMTGHLTKLTQVQGNLNMLLSVSKDTGDVEAAATKPADGSKPPPLLEACEVFLKKHSSANPVCPYCGCGRDERHWADCVWLAFLVAVRDAHKATEVHPMMYKPGDKVKAKNWREEGFPWQPATVEDYRPDLDRHIVRFDGESWGELSRPCDIRRREAEPAP